MKFLSRFFSSPVVDCARELVVTVLICFGSFISLAAFAPLADAATSAAPYLGTCEYYDHLSASLACPADGYLVGFGSRYCKKFEREMSRFTRAGEDTVAVIRLCLQKKLEAEPVLSCGNVGAIGAASHVDCYVSGGFCEMDLWDSAALTSIVWPALLTRQMAAIPLKVERACLARRAGRPTALRTSEPAGSVD